MQESHKKKKRKPVSKKKRFVRIVEAIIKDARGRILILKRSTNNSIYVGKWQLPGGKAEKGETALQTANRELLEELGCKCFSFKLLKKIIFTEMFKGSKSTVELSIFSCKMKGSILLSKDHTIYKFVNSARIEKRLLAPVSKKALFD